MRIVGSLGVSPTAEASASGARNGALPAILLVQADDVVSPDALIDDLWPDEPPLSAAKTHQADVCT